MSKKSKVQGLKVEGGRREEGLRAELVSTLNKGNSEDMAPPPESLRNQGVRGEKVLIPAPFGSVPKITP